MKLFEKTIDSKTMFDGKIIKVTLDDVTLENGRSAKREVVHHGGGVCVLVLDDEDNVYFVKQFRYPYKEVVLEVPAGKLEKGEDPFDAMKREQREETGTTASTYIYLGELYPTPGYCGEIIRIWACRADAYLEMNLDEDEFIEIEKIHIEKAFQMVLENKIPDSKTQVAIMKTYILFKENKI